MLNRFENVPNVQLNSFFFRHACNEEERHRSDSVLNCKPLKGSQQEGDMMCSISKMTYFLHGEFLLLYDFLCQLLLLQREVFWSLIN